ncbi:MAG: hypothetical protein GXY86_12755, partial [Firmicutes bacterium]|nr:hypothetical protein [Bacillota bacterium]
ETDGVTTSFYWDGDALLGDVTGDDTREWVYYPGSFEPLVMVRNEEFYLYHNEPNGCPSRLLDESGKVVWAARYDAWGEVKKLVANDIDQPLRLQGQYFDRETGLYYNRFRYYAAEIGAFISQDPLGLAAGENVYRFAWNIWKYSDPLGLHCEGIDVDPKQINFSQTSVNRNFDTPNGKMSIEKVIRQGPEQVKDFPPIKVVEVKGQLVVRDGNSRLLIARETKAETIKAVMENDLNCLRDLFSRLKKNNLLITGTNKPPIPR